MGHILRGFDERLRKLWTETLADRDAALVITADHGAISVLPEQMVVLPTHLVECLEYANIGIFGQGRHAIFHCKAGRQTDFAKCAA